jgi:hypothetical protein
LREEGLTTILLTLFACFKHQVYVLQYSQFFIDPHFPVVAGKHHQQYEPFKLGLISLLKLVSAQQRIAAWMAKPFASTPVPPCQPTKLNKSQQGLAAMRQG